MTTVEVSIAKMCTNCTKKHKPYLCCKCSRAGHTFNKCTFSMATPLCNICGSDKHKYFECPCYHSKLMQKRPNHHDTSYDSKPDMPDIMDTSMFPLLK